MSDANQQMDMSWSAIRFPMTRGEHQIVLELAMWSSRERLWVNDECILERKSWRFQNSHVFELDGEMIHIDYGYNTKGPFCTAKANLETFYEYQPQSVSWVYLAIIAFIGGVGGFFFAQSLLG